jgi:hypothetical protein
MIKLYPFIVVVGKMNIFKPLSHIVTEETLKSRRANMNSTDSEDKMDHKHDDHHQRVGLEIETRKRTIVCIINVNVYSCLPLSSCFASHTCDIMHFIFFPTHIATAIFQLYAANYLRYVTIQHATCTVKSGVHPPTLSPPPPTQQGLERVTI